MALICRISLRAGVESQCGGLSVLPFRAYAIDAGRVVHAGAPAIANAVARELLHNSGSWLYRSRVTLQ